MLASVAKHTCLLFCNFILSHRSRDCRIRSTCPSGASGSRQQYAAAYAAQVSHDCLQVVQRWEEAAAAAEAEAATLAEAAAARPPFPPLAALHCAAVCCRANCCEFVCCGVRNGCRSRFCCGKVTCRHQFHRVDRTCGREGQLHHIDLDLALRAFIVPSCAHCSLVQNETDTFPETASASTGPAASQCCPRSRDWPVASAPRCRARRRSASAGPSKSPS
jgi:hypothetical protein